MRISRYLKEDAIKLELETEIPSLEEGKSEDKWRQDGKELLIDELVTVLESGWRIGNRTKLVTDFVNRERKATTAIGDGVAIPHIRSMQAKEFMIGFGRSTEGYDFGAPDGSLSHLFFVMAAPPYDDGFYLKVFKALAEMLQYESFRDDLMNAYSEGEIIRAVRSME